MTKASFLPLKTPAGVLTHHPCSASEKLFQWPLFIFSVPLKKKKKKWQCSTLNLLKLYLEIRPRHMYYFLKKDLACILLTNKTEQIIRANDNSK